MSNLDNDWKANARDPELTYSDVETIIIRGLMMVVPKSREGFNIDDKFEQMGIIRIGQIQRLRDVFGSAFGITIPEEKLRHYTTPRELAEYIYTLTI